MNPELKKIGNKLFLGAQKVEVGLIDDINKANSEFNKYISNANSAWEQYQNYLTNADKPFKKMIDSYNKLSDSISKYQSIPNKAISQAKDLGIDIKQIKGLDDLQANIKESNIQLNIINSFKDPSSFQ